MRDTAHAHATQVRIVSSFRMDDRSAAPMPDLFRRLDLDGSSDLDAAEVSNHFELLQKPVPAHIWEREDVSRTPASSHPGRVAMRAGGPR